MEYYDSTNNAQLHYYYSNRNASLLSNEEVLNLISKESSNRSFNEENPIALSEIQNNHQHEKTSLLIEENLKIEIFKQNSLVCDRNSNLNSIILPELWKNVFKKTIGSKSINRKDSIATIFYNAKKKENHLKFKQTTEEEIKKFDQSANKIEELINYEMSNQLADFEKRKKEKKEKKSKTNILKQINYVNSGKNRPSKIDDMLMSYCIFLFYMISYLK
jgi:hypothetical protein